MVNLPLLAFGKEILKGVHGRTKGRASGAPALRGEIRGAFLLKIVFIISLYCASLITLPIKMAPLNKKINFTLRNSAFISCSGRISNLTCYGPEGVLYEIGPTWLPSLPSSPEPGLRRLDGREACGRFLTRLKME
jgi:hypothetical protein